MIDDTFKGQIRGFKELLPRIGLSRGTVDNMTKLGRFPKPIKKVQEGRKKMNVWSEAEVCEWLSRRSVL